MEHEENFTEENFIECDSFSGDEKKKDGFLKSIDTKIEDTSTDYIKVMQNLDEHNLKVGTSWLLSIVEKIRNSILNYLPSFI